MWNLRSLKMSVMLVASGVVLVAALPVKAQQVILTPGGTMIQQMSQAPLATPPSFDEILKQMRQAPEAGSKVPTFDEILKYMGQAPVATPEAGSITPGGEELKEQPPYVFVPAPGTGIDGEKRPGPVEVTTITGPILEIDPDALIGGPGGVKYSELAKGDKPDSSRTYTPEELAEAYRRGEIAYLHGFSAANPVAGNNLSSQSGPTVLPGGITGTASFSAATASGSGQIPVSAISNPSTVFPTISQPVIANQVALPVTSVTVQPSQNPTADFATTRSAPRNTVPEQLNRGVVDSPLSNSRIFPGMR